MLSRFRTLFLGSASTALMCLSPMMVKAQTATSVPAPSGPAINDVAPDFSLPGATRYGLLKTPVRLSDYRGSTVVLAFFFKARTKG